MHVGVGVHYNVSVARISAVFRGRDGVAFGIVLQSSVTGGGMCATHVAARANNEYILILSDDAFFSQCGD